MPRLFEVTPDTCLFLLVAALEVFTSGVVRMKLLCSFEVGQKIIGGQIIETFVDYGTYKIISTKFQISPK